MRLLLLLVGIWCGSLIQADFCPDSTGSSKAWIETDPTNGWIRHYLVWNPSTVNDGTWIQINTNCTLDVEPTFHQNTTYSIYLPTSASQEWFFDFPMCENGYWLISHSLSYGTLCPSKWVFYGTQVQFIPNGDWAPTLDQAPTLHQKLSLDMDETGLIMEIHQDKWLIAMDVLFGTRHRVSLDLSDFNKRLDKMAETTDKLIDTTDKWLESLNTGHENAVPDPGMSDNPRPTCSGLDVLRQRLENGVKLLDGSVSAIQELNGKTQILLKNHITELRTYINSLIVNDITWNSVGLRDQMDDMAKALAQLTDETNTWFDKIHSEICRETAILDLYDLSNKLAPMQVVKVQLPSPMEVASVSFCPSQTEPAMWRLEHDNSGNWTEDVLVISNPVEYTNELMFNLDAWPDAESGVSYPITIPPHSEWRRSVRDFWGVNSSATTKLTVTFGLRGRDLVCAGQFVFQTGREPFFRPGS